MLQTVGKEGFGDHVLRSILFQFVQDPCFEVRRLVAMFLHELCSILSAEQCTVHVFDVLKKLLKDKDARVWQKPSASNRFGGLLEQALIWNRVPKPNTVAIGYDKIR